MPKLTNSVLCALFGLTGVGCVNNGPVGNYTPISVRSRESYMQNLSQNSSTSFPMQSSNQGTNVISEVVEDKDASTRMGIIGVSRESVNLQIPYLTTISLPVRDYSQKYGDFSYDDPFSGEDGWRVSRINSYSPEPQPVPISFLSKLVKQEIWDSDIAKPARGVGQALSDLTNTPASYIFGRGAKSELRFKLDSERAGIQWLVRKGRWNWEGHYEENFQTGEYDAGISVGTKIGPEKVQPLIDHRYR